MQRNQRSNDQHPLDHRKRKRIPEKKSTTALLITPKPLTVSVQSLSCVQLFATPWTVAYQASLSIGFSRQQCWSGLPFPSPGDLPDPGIEPGSPALHADALPSEPPGKPRKSKWQNIKAT